MDLQEATIKLITEDYEQDNQLSINEQGIPELPRPYKMSKYSNKDKFYITSSHPYDLTDYCWAVSKDDNINGSWQIIDDDQVVNAAIGWNEALKIMQEIDSKKKARIDRS